MEKHSMRHILWAALFLLYCSCGCLAAVVQQLPQKGESALQAYTVSAPPAPPAAPKTGVEWQPIRIAVYTKRVEDVLKFCTTGALPPEYQDEFLETDEVEDEFEELCGVKGVNKKIIAERKEILLNKVLPKAIKLHADRLNVEQVKESLKIETDSVKKPPQECGEFGIPKEHETNGIPNADFVIYARLSTNIGHGICSKDKQGRPTSAVIKFVLYDIEATRKYIRFTAHEIAHGLGFQHDLMKGLGMIVSSKTYLKPDAVPCSKKRSAGTSDYMVKFKEALEVLKNHYKCQGDEVKGLCLENDDQWTPSHWEREFAKDELMSTYIGEPTGMYYTALTLAAFHGMSFYRANFSMAEPMGWSNQSICEFLQGKKDPTQTDRPYMFCKENEKKEILQCTSDRFALGMCLTKKNLGQLPNGYQYFHGEDSETTMDDLMDGYPIIRPLNGTVCEGGDENLLPGSLLGRDSRCLNAKGLFLRDPNGHRSHTMGGVCAKVKCDNANKKVSVQLKGYDKKKELIWHECNDDNAAVKLEGSFFESGTIKCPKYEEVCTGLPKTNSLKIKYYSGKQDLEARDVVVNDDDEETGAATNTDVRAQETTTRSPFSPDAVVNEPHVPHTEQEEVKESPENKHPDKPEDTSLKRPSSDTKIEQPHQEVNKPIESQNSSPNNPRIENNHDNGLPSRSAGSSSGIGSASGIHNGGVSRGTNDDNSSALGSGASGNERNPVNGDQSVQSETSSSAPVVPVVPAKTPAAPAPADTDTNEIPQQPADSRAENKDQQNGIQTPTQAQDRQQGPNQTQNEVQFPNEVKTPSQQSTPQYKNSSTSPTTDEKDAQEEDHTSRNRRNTDAATSPNTSYPNTGDAANDQSSHTVNSDSLKVPNLTEDQIKEETLNHTNVMSALGPDSSIMFSHMAPLALLMCVVGFVMVP
ncbi:surface protease GP63 [Trypanosoma theileri]|uniref:leishmanolysin n=1 Tax=Trypanosoma theileri TaxID=67003 RepID=A0A1X0NK29_9TRYP|nr:surface protease GP63 [Trypanosoma theileri]ORC85124.1 surface protease GP63 [Trypanosoma theileri]